MCWKRHCAPIWKRAAADLERASGWLGAFRRRGRSAVVYRRRVDDGAALHSGASGAGAAGVRAGRAEPGLDRGPVRRGREHALPLAADVADRRPPGSEAARRRPGAAPGRGGLGRAQGAGGRGERPDAGRVRGRAARARRGGGERPDRVPGAREARPDPQKRPYAPRSRTGRSSCRRGPSGGPSWPASSRGASCSSTSAGSTLGWPGPMPAPPGAGAQPARRLAGAGGG